MGLVLLYGLLWLLQGGSVRASRRRAHALKSATRGAGSKLFSSPFPRLPPMPLHAAAAASAAVASTARTALAARNFYGAVTQEDMAGALPAVTVPVAGASGGGST